MMNPRIEPFDVDGDICRDMRSIGDIMFPGEISLRGIILPLSHIQVGRLNHDALQGLQRIACNYDLFKCPCCGIGWQDHPGEIESSCPYSKLVHYFMELQIQLYQMGACSNLFSLATMNGWSCTDE